MRIISGTARGRRLKTLEGMDVRPTTEKVKEAFFSLSTQEIYEEVKKYASNAVNYATLKFPGFLQVRKIWIS